MRPNRTKALLREGKIALGISHSQIRSAEIPRMFAAAGLDWIFIDSEHGPFTPETLQDVVQGCLQTPLTPFVRVADFQYSLVARALDIGAEGLILPRVEDPEVLKNAVSWAKFPPKGVRGFGLGAPQIGYDNAPFDQVIRHLNDELLIAAQIESRVGLDRCDEIIAVEGADILLIGPADLSISLGVAGQWEHPDLIAAISRVVEACDKHGKWAAIQTRTTALAERCMELGVKLVSSGNELALLWGATAKTAAELKAARERN